MSQLQVSLAAMFVVTALAALMVVIMRQLGPYWLIVSIGCVVCVQLPAWNGVHPLALAVGYMAVALLFTCGLACWFNVQPIYSMVPCAVLPALAYIVGFVKGMENA